MKKIVYVFAAAILFATSCVEPVYQITDADKYPRIPEFPKEFQGVYIKAPDSLIVGPTSFRIVSTNSDIPKSGSLKGDGILLKKHGAYHVVYSSFNGSMLYFHLRFFTLSNKILTVKKLGSDKETRDKIAALSIKHKVEEDPDEMTDDQHYFTMDGATLQKLISQFLVEEYSLTKVK